MSTFAASSVSLTEGSQTNSARRLYIQPVGLDPVPRNGPGDFNTSASCTLDTFRDFYRTHHYFPGNGRWVPLDDYHVRFQPDFCNFSDKPLGDDIITQCIQVANLASILILGDSNSGRYFHSLLGILGNVSASARHRRGRKKPACRVVYQEETPDGWFPNASHYKRGDGILDGAIRTHYRHCGNCIGKVAECRYQLPDTGEHTLRVERYSLTSLVDTSVSLLVPKDMKNYHHEYWAPTSAEFLFRYYLRDRYPGLIFFFVPFAHIKQGSNTVERIRGDMEYFHFLARTWLPASTKLFYLTAPAEHDDKKKGEWNGKLFQGMLATEKLDRLNRMMYEVLAADLENGTVYGSLDLVALGKDRGHWSEDGIHMQEAWYRAIDSLLLETVCNSVRQLSDGRSQSPGGHVEIKTQGTGL